MTTPTDEQLTALALFREGIGLAIEAGAGTGKTTTLTMLGESTGRRGQYVAFNRAIVEESKRKMPDNVKAATNHSLAMRQTGHVYRHRLQSGRMRSDHLARALRIDPMYVTYGSQKKVIQPGTLASLAMRAIAAFCNTADEAPDERHVPYLDGIDVPKDNGDRTWRNNEEVRKALAPVLVKAWTDLCDPKGQLPYNHDHYLKLWQLSGPVIPADFIMLDEAQDASPVMIDAIAKQTSAQLVFVGDSQQQIYEWRGAVNALESVPAEARAWLTQSFRFGPAIADVANKMLDTLNAELRLTGLDSIGSTIGYVENPDAILTRSNACAVSTVLQLQRTNHRPCLLGGGAQVLAFARAARDLMDRGSTGFPDLCCFTSWGEVQDYVANDPQGGDLKLLVGLVDDFGIDVIESALAHMPPEQQADVVVSTAHKAKGREWSRVRLAEDFASIEPSSSIGEWRLLYVAATRAQHALDIELCEPVRELVFGPRTLPMQP